MPVGDVAPEIAVLLTAIAALLLATFLPRRLQGLAAPLALAGIAVAAVLCAAQLAEARLTFFGVWALDGASTWGRLMILAATALVVLMTPGWLATDARHGEFYTMLLMSALGAMAMAAAADLLQLVLGVLLSSVTGYTLAAYHRDWPPSLEAGMKYFLVGALANALLVIGVTLLWGMAGAAGFAELGPTLGERGAGPLVVLGLALVIAGLAFKLGAVPAHAWMPDVAQGAPAPAAAFLTVVPKIGAAIALIRLVDLLAAEVDTLRPLVAIIAALTMTLGNLAALRQDDLRRLLGWSAVSQSGYALMAVAVVGLTDAALGALLVFLAGYAAANLAAFAVVTHLRGRTALEHYAGLAAVRPLPAIALTVSLLSLVGIPPLAGFVGKLALFVATIEGDAAWLAAVAVANTVLSLAYYLRVVSPMVFGATVGQVHRLDRASAVALGLGTALVAVVGLAAHYPLAAFATARLLP